MNKKRYMVVCLVLAMTSICSAVEYEGVLKKISGEVHVTNLKGKKLKPDVIDFKVKSGETVSTLNDSRVLIKFTDESTIILNANSSLTVEDPTTIKHNTGNIYYAYRKKPESVINVRLKTAMMGIRGTTFIVSDVKDELSVALKEGILDIKSIGSPFNVYKNKNMDDYKALEKVIASGVESEKLKYETYRNEIKTEFVEYKKNLLLEADTILKFDGNKVMEYKLDSAINDAFVDFQKYAGDLLD